MILTAMFILSAGATVPAYQETPAPAASAQSVNGGKPQTVHEEKRSTQRAGKERMSDGMNTKGSTDSRKRDAYGTPVVTPPPGQGTDNSGGIPPASDPLKTKQ